MRVRARTRVPRGSVGESIYRFRIVFVIPVLSPFLLQNALPADGVLKCPVCKEARRFASIQEIGQLTKNHTLQTLKRAEHHRIAPIGVCELCNKKSAYGRCFHCRSLACFKCMDEHERNLADEHAKEYAELVKIRDQLHQKISQWDKKLTESKDHIRKTIQTDAEKQTKEIKGKNFPSKYFALVFIFRT